MRFFLDEAQIDRVVAARRLCLGGGAALMALPFFLPRGWGVGSGFFAGFSLSSLGLHAALLTRWRTEPGLWMLALLLSLVFGAGWAVFALPALQGLFDPDPARGPRSWADVRLAIDGAIAVALFGTIARFAASVAVANRARTAPPARPRHRPGSPPVQNS